MRVCGHLYVRLCVRLCIVCLCACVVICVYVLVCAWTCTCKCVSLQFCNVNVYHFRSYHYCSIWHGYTVHNDMESMVLFFTISRRLVNVNLSGGTFFLNA